MWELPVPISNVPTPYWIPSGGVCIGYNTDAYPVFSNTVPTTSWSLPAYYLGGYCDDGTILLAVPPASASKFTYDLCIANFAGTLGGMNIKRHRNQFFNRKIKKN